MSVAVGVNVAVGVSVGLGLGLGLGSGLGLGLGIGLGLGGGVTSNEILTDHDCGSRSDRVFDICSQVGGFSYSSGVGNLIRCEFRLHRE